jgi:hypothetical protein
MHVPEKDRSFVSKTYMEEEIIVLLGGRVAEKLILDDISTGASNDIERATSVARNMDRNIIACFKNLFQSLSLEGDIFFWRIDFPVDSFFLQASAISY